MAISFWSKARSYLKYLTLSKFSEATESGRSDERMRRAVLSVLANVLSKTASLILMILSVSLTLPYLGIEKYGFWAAIVSFTGLLTLLDMGVGNAMTNLVAQRATLSDRDGLRKIISGGIGVLFFVGFGAGVVVYTLSQFVPWSIVLKSDSINIINEVESVAALFAFLFGLSIVSGGLQKVFLGLQLAYESHLMALLGALLAIFSLWFCAKSNADIKTLLLATFGVQTIVNFSLIFLLAKRKYFYIPEVISSAKAEFPKLFSSGGLFFTLQLAAILGWVSDSVLISSQLGIAAVAIFAIVQRLFQLVSLPLAILNAPLWPAYADAHARGDSKFIRKTFFKSVALTSGLALLGVSIILIFFEDIVRSWTHGAIEIPFNLVFCFALWSIIECLAVPLAMLLNGCGIVYQQAIFAVFFAAIVFPAKWFALESYGLSALPISTIIVYLFSLIIFYGIIFRRDISRLLD